MEFQDNWKGNKNKNFQFISNVKAMLLYASEYWKLHKGWYTGLYVFINKCLWIITNIHWPDRISNKKIWKKTSLNSHWEEVMAASPSRHLVVSVVVPASWCCHHQVRGLSGKESPERNVDGRFRDVNTRKMWIPGPELNFRDLFGSRPTSSCQFGHSLAKQGVRAVVCQMRVLHGGRR